MLCHRMIDEYFTVVLFEMWLEFFLLQRQIDGLI
jgi:hypothetical protein